MKKNKKPPGDVPIARPSPSAPSDPSVPPLGLECRKCGCRHFYVVYTRPLPSGKILRRRECRHCGQRLTTYEQAP